MFVNCLEPKIIVNRALPQLLATYRNYYLNGKWEYCNFPELALFNKNYLRKFYRIKKSVTLENIDNYYVVDDNGYSYPIYIATKCNHCILCTESSHKTYVQRLLAEAQLYKTRPLFLTLTYRDSHLPNNGVSVRDIQLFLKRFRQNLIRNMHYDEKIRYFVCSEYGQDDNYTHRAHYHAILFNVPTNNPSLIWQTRDLISQSWQHGFVKCRVVDMSKPRDFYYTSKYLYKDQVVPDGMNKPFALSSRRHGGIGSQFFRTFRNYLLESKTCELKYADRFCGTLRPIALSHYVLHHVLPTFNESVSIKWRKDAHMFNSLYTAYEHIDEIRLFYGDFHAKLQSYLSPYMTLEPSLHKTKYPNLKYAHFALSSLRDDLVTNLESLNFFNLKNIEYVRKDVVQKLASSLVSLSSKELKHKADLLSINRSIINQKKQLHYVK